MFSYLKRIVNLFKNHYFEVVSFEIQLIDLK